MSSVPQTDAQGRLRHLLAIEGLGPDLITRILDNAETFLSASEQSVRKVPLLRGKTVCNLFFEPSTRTRTTFELAAKRLSADVINIDAATSATTKGETLLDTLETLQAMNVDLFVIRHEKSGTPAYLAGHARLQVSVINAGDGSHAHPTQALLDVLTIRRHRPDFGALRVAIVGDIRHSRVARSEIQALNALGAGEVRVVGPASLMPDDVDALNVKPFDELAAGIDGVDVVIMLRIQKERMKGPDRPSTDEFFRTFGLTSETLKAAAPDALVMHPGPINRDVEITAEVAYGPQSVILEQVTNGIAIRMAVMSMALGRSD